MVHSFHQQKSPPPRFINMTDSRAHRHSDTRRLNVYQICFRRSKYSTDGLQASTTNLFRSPRKGAYLALFRWMGTDLAVEMHRVRLCQTGKTEMLRLALIYRHFMLLGYSSRVQGSLSTTNYRARMNSASIALHLTLRTAPTLLIRPSLGHQNPTPR
jgi:hypothetical protein